MPGKSLLPQTWNALETETWPLHISHLRCLHWAKSLLELLQGRELSESMRKVHKNRSMVFLRLLALLHPSLLLLQARPDSPVCKLLY